MLYASRTKFEAIDSILRQTPNHILKAAFEWVKNEINYWKDVDLSAEKKTQNLIGQEFIGDSNLDIQTSPGSTLEISGIAPFT